MVTLVYLGSSSSSQGLSLSHVCTGSCAMRPMLTEAPSIAVMLLLIAVLISDSEDIIRYMQIL